MNNEPKKRRRYNYFRREDREEKKTTTFQMPVEDFKNIITWGRKNKMRSMGATICYLLNVALKTVENEK